MQSYSAARSLFTFLAGLAWCALLGGAALAAIAAGIVSEYSRSAPAMVSAAVPGIAISLFGFLALVMVQIGRASVDSAEYGQQSLQVARDQLAFAKQVHLETKGSAAASTAMSPVPQSLNAAVMSHAPRAEPIRYNDTAIIAKDGGTYAVSDRTFATLDEAKQFIDIQRVRSR